MTTGRINQVCTKTEQAPQEPPERPRVRRQAFRTKNQQKILNIGRVADASASVSEPSLHSDTSEPGNSGDAQRRPNKYQSRWWCTPKHASKLISRNPSSSNTHIKVFLVADCARCASPQPLQAPRSTKTPKCWLPLGMECCQQNTTPATGVGAFSQGLEPTFPALHRTAKLPHENSPVIPPARGHARTRARVWHLLLFVSTSRPKQFYVDERRLGDE